jgi:hypothetical protein
MRKKLIIGFSLISLAIIAFFVWETLKTKRLQTLATQCSEKNLCVDTDNFVCIECEEKITKKDTAKNIMLSGLLSKAEVTSYQYGTHQLNGNILDGNPGNIGKEILFALKSDKINLDEWLGKKVIITGRKVAGYPVENGPDYVNVTAIEADQISSVNQVL